MHWLHFWRQSLNVRDVLTKISLCCSHNRLVSDLARKRLLFALWSQPSYRMHKLGSEIKKNQKQNQGPWKLYWFTTKPRAGVLMKYIVFESELEKWLRHLLPLHAKLTLYNWLKHPTVWLWRDSVRWQKYRHAYKSASSPSKQGSQGSA